MSARGALDVYASPGEHVIGISRPQPTAAHDDERDLGFGAVVAQESRARLVNRPSRNAFFFSVQTFATIGYGQIAPAGTAANVVVVIESFLSLVFLTVVTGIVFAWFSRPTARILFSERAVIAPHRGMRAFMIRLVNVRQAQLFDLEVKIACAASP